MVNKNPVVLVICEGEKTEKVILRNMLSVFNVENASVIAIDLLVPYKRNIYDLYLQQKKNSDCDVLDILKEMEVKDVKDIDRNDVSEIYLFFDSDLHSDGLNSEENLKKLQEMLSFYNDENEQGKLYISYPMVEAIKDLNKQNICVDRCVSCISLGREYKKDVADNQKDFLHISSFARQDWNFFCSHAICKANCILNNQYALCTYDVGKNFTQDKIFTKQRQLVESKNLVYVLSGFPFFLLEYFGNNKWSEWQVPSGYKLEKAEVCPLKK